MASIRQLDPVTINHIAAGEVVERPASVVKELADNALDAGASQIYVTIRNGGISEITVKDNGGGMNEADAKNSLLSHYTSKIAQINDLETISTMGFRGEALPSIASVSRLHLRTREPGTEMGYEIKAESGQILTSGICSCPEGTTITVKDLFFNTPARYKFLKKDNLEAGYIADTLRKLALTRPDVSFQLTGDDKRTILYTPGNNDLLSTIYAAFDRKTAEGMITVDSMHNPVRVFGYMSKPENARANRSRQVFIVNGRNINSKTLTAAVDEAIRSWFVKGRFPALVLQITVPKELVDINVHPQKSEVRFWNDREVFRAVYHAIQNTLAAETEIPSLLLPEKEIDTKEQIDYSVLPAQELKDALRDRTSPFVDTVNEPALQSLKTPHKSDYGDKIHYDAITARQRSDDKPANAAYGDDIVLTAAGRRCGAEQVSLTELAGAAADRFTESRQESAAVLRIDALENARIIGVFSNIYILLEAEEDLIIIDQHAAHERILYEELLAGREKSEKKNIPSQLLLVPQKMKVSELEAAALTEHNEEVLALGFEFEFFGKDTIVIRAVPEVRVELNPELAFSAVIDACLNDNIEGQEQANNELLHDIACKAAVKANDHLEEVEIERLLSDLVKLDNPYHCPHGRPVLIRFTRKDLDKKFRRIVD